MEANIKHLLRLWALAIFLGALVVAGLINAVARGQYLPAIAVCVGLAIAAFSILQGRRKAVLLFKESTPDRAITYYHSSRRRMPNGKAMGAYLSAYAAVLYGRFDQAREELASVNWTALPPLYQGFEAYIHSLLAIFQLRDYTQALSLAEEARELCAVAGKFPGSNTSRAALDANFAVCELLVGKDSPDVLDRLHRATEQLPGVSPALPAWALAAYYSKTGQQSAAARYLSIVQRLVPHCAPLNDLHPAGSAQS